MIAGIIVLLQMTLQQATYSIALGILFSQQIFLQWLLSWLLHN